MEELKKLFAALENLRRGKSMPDEPTYTQDGDHLTANVTPQQKKSPLEIQIKHNELIGQYNRQKYQELHKAPEWTYSDPKQKALKLALILDQRLNLDDMSWFSDTGSGYGAIWTCIQLLRQLGNE